MTERTGYAAGTPCWADLGTPDLDGAIRFYGGLFGWDVDKGGEEFGFYSMCRKDGKNIAGIMPIQQGSEQPPAWSIYLASDDADATAQKARDGGAQIAMEPMDVMDQGRMLVAFDPTGAAFGVWQPGAHVGTQLVDEPGTPCWFELRARDAKAADEFYGSLFPYTLGQAGDGENFDYVTLSIGGQTIGGRMRMGSEFPAEVPAHWALYFAVEDADATAQQVTKLGGTVVREPTDTPHGRMGAVQDPWGASFDIIKPAPTTTG